MFFPMLSSHATVLSDHSRLLCIPFSLPEIALKGTQVRHASVRRFLFAHTANSMSAEDDDSEELMELRDQKWTKLQKRPRRKWPVRRTAGSSRNRVKALFCLWSLRTARSRRGRKINHRDLQLSCQVVITRAPFPIRVRRALVFCTMSG